MNKVKVQVPEEKQNTTEKKRIIKYVSYTTADYNERQYTNDNMMWSIGDEEFKHRHSF